MFGLTIGMPFSNLQDGLKCNTPIITWLFVQSGIYFANFLKDMLILVSIKHSSNGRQVKNLIDILYALFVLNFQAAWLIYGNTFQYSDAGLACKNGSDGGSALWSLMMFIIAFGYIFLLTYAILCCCLSCVACCVLVFRNDIQQHINNPMVSRIPYAAAITGLNKKSFDKLDTKNKNMSECVICMMDFKDTDEIAELKCDERHYFHSACLEDWLKRKLECPLCKKPVLP